MRVDASGGRSVGLSVEVPVEEWDAPFQGLLLVEVCFDPDDVLHLCDVRLNEGPKVPVGSCDGLSPLELLDGVMDVAAVG